MRKPVKFTFGGVPRSVVVEIGLAGEIEAALGRGIFAIAAQARSLELPFFQSLEIVRLAVAKTGVKYTEAEALERAAVEGIADTIITAGLIINELFLPFTDDKKGKRKGSDGPLATGTR